MRNLLTISFFFFVFSFTNAQINLEVAGGNGLISNSGATRLKVFSKDIDANSIVEFGDDNSVKASVGFDGSDDVLRLSGNSSFNNNDFTINSTGKIGVNSLPSNSRIFINHNSSAGVLGSPHLELQESNSVDFSRLKFTNLGSTALWTLAARATPGSANFNVFYNDGTNFGNIMSFDGDLSRVGINTTTPEAYLHIKQKDVGVDALVLENDDQTGSEKWSFRIDNDDLLFLFEDQIRAVISSADGSYTAVPPAAFAMARVTPKNQAINDIMKIDLSEDMNLIASLNDKMPQLLYKSDDLKKDLLDYNQITTLSLKVIQEQQEILEEQGNDLEILKQFDKELDEKIREIQDQIKLIILNKN